MWMRKHFIGEHHYCYFVLRASLCIRISLRPGCAHSLYTFYGGVTQYCLLGHFCNLEIVVIDCLHRNFFEWECDPTYVDAYLFLQALLDFLARLVNFPQIFVSFGFRIFHLVQLPCILGSNKLIKPVRSLQNTGKASEVAAWSYLGSHQRARVDRQYRCLTHHHCDRLCQGLTHLLHLPRAANPRQGLAPNRLRALIACRRQGLVQHLRI